MISQRLLERLKNSIDKNIILFLNGNFRFEGRIISCDDEFLEFWDTKKNLTKFVKLDEISEVGFF